MTRRKSRVAWRTARASFFQISALWGPGLYCTPEAVDVQGSGPYFPTQKRWKIRAVTSSRTDSAGELPQGAQGLLHIGEQGIGGDPQVQGLPSPADGLQRTAGGLRLALVGEQFPIAGAGLPGKVWATSSARPSRPAPVLAQTGTEAARSS